MTQEFDVVLLTLEEAAKLRAEIEQLKEQLASLQASSGYEASIAQLEIERLLDALKAIECHSIDHTDACRMAGKARAALEPKPFDKPPPLIERQRAEIGRLTAVLRCIAGMGAVDCDEAPTLARRALEPKP